MLRLCFYVGLVIFGRLLVGKRLGVDTAGWLSSTDQRDIPYNITIPFPTLSNKSLGKGGSGVFMATVFIFPRAVSFGLGIAGSTRLLLCTITSLLLSSSFCGPD